MRAASERENLGGLREPDRDGHDAAALDTPALAEMACRQAGVELWVVGAESCEETGISARLRRGAEMPDELAAALRRHRVGLIARLLVREPILGDVPGVFAARLREGRDGSSTLGDLWPAECLESQAKFGHRCGRLYPLLDGDVLIRGEDGGVATGTLLQALGDRAMVEVPGDPPVHPFGDPEKLAYVPVRFVSILDVWPMALRTASRPRAPRTRPHDGEDGLRVLPASSPASEEERP